MAEDDTSNAQALQQPEPNPDLRNLDRLVGTWEISGGAQGRATYEWMEGDFFLIQRVDLQQHGQKIKGIEIIGHERQFGAEPSEDIGSRFYDNMGNTLDYVYELEGDTLTIWGGERGSPAYYRGTFSEDDKTISGAWHYPGRRLRGDFDQSRIEEDPMAEGTARGDSVAAVPSTAPRLSFAGAATFVILLAALHFIKPGLDPS